MMYTYSGSNSFALQQALNKQVEAFVSMHGDFGLERLDASQLTSQALLESVLATPFLASKRLLIIHDPAENKVFADALAGVLDAISKDTDIIFIQTKFDKRSGIYKFLKKHSNFIDFEELNDLALQRWITDSVAAQQGTISSADARYVIARVGISQRKIHSELDKLLNYNKKISKESINLLTVRTIQSTIFDLIESAFAGQMTTALSLHKEQRMQKVEPLQIVAMIVWQLHILATIKAGTSKSPDTIAKDAKLNPYVVRKSLKLAQRMSLKEIKSLVARTRELERRLKRESIDGDEALLELFMHFNQP